MVESLLSETQWDTLSKLEEILGNKITSINEYERYRSMYYSFEMPFMPTHDALEIIKMFHGYTAINRFEYREIKYDNQLYLEKYENAVIRNLDIGNPTYYLGISDAIYNRRYVISTSLFLTYEYKIVKQYLINMLSNQYSRACDFIDYGNLQIMSTRKINDYQSVVVNSTFWLRLIQRHWKRLCLKRKLIIRKWKTIKMVRYMETHYVVRRLPGLKGLMNVYCRANK